MQAWRWLALGAPMLAAASAGAAAAPRGHRVMRLGALKVQGRAQKPQAFYVLQRSSISVQAGELQYSFLPRVRRSIDDKPF